MASISTIWKPAGRSWKGNCHGCVTLHPGGWRICLRSQEHRNRTASLWIHRRKSNNQSPRRRPGCRPTKHLRQDWNSPHRRRPANRHPIILRQGLHGHDPAHPGIGGEPGYPGQITRAPLIQALENHQRYLSTRKHILDYPGEAQRQMDARASLRDMLRRIGKPR